MTTTDSTYDWLSWGLMDCPNGRLSPDVLTRIELDRMRAAELPLAGSRIPIRWRYDSSLRRRSSAAGVRLRSTWRRVAEFTIHGQHVYLEAFGGIGSAPGFGFRDVRIHLDEVLVGRAWRGGCSLGFGGGSGPAVALLQNNCAVRVTIPNSLSERDREEVDLLGHKEGAR